MMLSKDMHLLTSELLFSKYFGRQQPIFMSCILVSWASVCSLETSFKGKGHSFKIFFMNIIVMLENIVFSNIWNCLIE